MKVLGVIPSRYNSSRFPGKPLIDILGKSMIQRVYERVKEAQLFNKVIVATDDERIFNHVMAFGGESMMTADTHQSGTDRCVEVLEKYQDFDVVVNIQGDEPLVNPEQLITLVSAFSNPDVEIATLATHRIKTEDIQNPNRVKVVVDKIGHALYFSRSPIPFDLVSNNYPFLKHIGVYAFRSDVLLSIKNLEHSLLTQTESLEQLNWMYHGFKIKVKLTEIESPNVDVPEDLEFVIQKIKANIES